MWESASATEGNLGEVFNALEVVQGLLYPSAKGLKSAKVAGATAGNSTQNGGASTTSGVGAPQHTGAAGSVVASLTAVLAVALAAMLSL
jgi:mannan endo-1,6-alpha-mannosidase